MILRNLRPITLLICAAAVTASACSDDKSSATDAAVDARLDGAMDGDLDGLDTAPGDGAAAPDAGGDVLTAPLAGRVIRGDPTQMKWWDLTVRGGALQAYEGALVTVRIGRPDRPPERLGSGQARVTNGEFALAFPQVWESSLYKAKSVWIDVDGNGKCDSQVDLVFDDNRAAEAPALYVGEAGPGNMRMRLLSNSNFVGNPCAAFEGNWPAE